jgi:hypothetical protein
MQATRRRAGQGNDDDDNDDDDNCLSWEEAACGRAYIHTWGVEGQQCASIAGDVLGGSS